jgi:flavin reductase (DIM6/NTAB) family NADH-FMN oxidoreductase RutF
MEKTWMQALGKMTYGIYVLTTRHKSEINGMIASWVSQISYDPPLIMIAVHSNRYSNNLIRQSGHFTLHVLARDQNDLLERFKGPDPESKFDSITWFEGKTGCPVLKDCVAYMECDVTADYSPGNHTLFIGEVKNAQVFSKKEPLTTLDYSGAYIGKD